MAQRAGTFGSLLAPAHVLNSLRHSWSDRLFPKHAIAASETPPAGAWGFWFLLVVAGCLLFARLRSPLLEPDEARYAEIPREMLAEGHWIVPVLHGEPYYHKPPLLYWLVMVSFSAFGVHDWAARLVPCAASWFVVMVTCAWARRMLGARAAFAGAMILCLSARFVYLGRMLTLDPLLCLWVVTAWAGAHFAVRQQPLHRAWWILSAAACGLGLLTKGPVAIVLVAAPVLAFQILDGRTARPSWRSWAAFALIAFAVALPWYVALGLRDPQFLIDFFWTHNVVRFVAPLDHQAPPWYYLPGLLLGMMPWTFLLPALARCLFRRSGFIARHRPSALGFFLLTSVSCLGFFSISGCKRPGYILPAMPALALALGTAIDLILPSRLQLKSGLFEARSVTRLAWFATLAMLLVGAGMGLAAIVAGLTSPALGIALASAMVGLTAWLLFRGPSRLSDAAWKWCGGVTFAVLLAAFLGIEPGYARKFSIRAQVSSTRDRATDATMPVACYPHRWDSVSFYLGRDDLHIITPETRDSLAGLLRGLPSGILVFVKADDPHRRYVKDFEERLPVGLEFVPLSRPGLVLAGIVRRRAVCPERLLAERAVRSLDQ